MVALLKGKGYRFETVESTDESVTVRGTSPSGEQETSTWTLDRAKKAGYTSNKKYQTDPQAMLYAKAASEVSRRLAPDVLLGIKYTAEDLELEPVQMNAKRQDVARQALSAPAPKMKKQQKQDEQPDQFVEDVKQAIAELTTAEEVTSFMQEIRNDGDVPEEVIDLGRKRWNELQEEAK